ncbi:ribosomal protein S5 domain 2-type protein [Dipodascopsis tothii]|uniref:ribosomal protein S5 domain 2-type protein n=1 Tax=Dipodascopsis tothii TaxID=44089 RepID=UPI0034CD31D0
MTVNEKVSEEFVPYFESLIGVYDEHMLEVQLERWRALSSKFRETYNMPADFVARSPGRVNVIGEHIDYSWFGVLPMAITQDVLVAVSVAGSSEDGENQLVLSNTNPRFPTRTFNVNELESYAIDSTHLEWSNYFLSGFKGALKLLNAQSSEPIKFPNMKCLIDGRIPTGGGLSSSSAFVCAALLSVLSAVRCYREGTDSLATYSVSRSELVGSAVVSERFVGVNSGGMDQSASVFGLRDHALYVQFVPELDVTPLEFAKTSPPLAFVIANSLVVADKHVTGPIHYNLRVVETTLAAEVLAKMLKTGPLVSRDGFGGTLKGFFDGYCKLHQLPVGTIEEQHAAFALAIKDVQSTLTQTAGYTMAEIADILEMSETELRKKYTSKFPIRADKLQLLARTLHVLEEAFRVLKFRSVMTIRGAEYLSAEDSGHYLKQIGELLNQSMTSCRYQYDCSCPELNELTSLALEAGAIGSRLTGAGWGGSTVNLIQLDKAESFIETLTTKYYNKRFPELTKEQLADAICVSRPANGSAIVKLASF